MSEELLQRGLDKEPEKIGKWDFYNIGATSIKALKEWGIISNFDYGMSIERKKVDGIIVYKKNVIAIIENKTPREFNTEKKQNKAIEQEIEVARKINCPIIIATDTQQTIWINSLTGKRILNENAIPISKNWNPSEVTKDTKLVILIEKIRISIDGQNDQIIPKKFVNPTDLAKQIWQDIWSVSGATPENCLYTFVELFIFKYLSDLKVLKTTNNFDFLMQMYEDNNTDDEVLQYYADTIRKKIKNLFPYNPTDNTTIINGTIFVSKDQKSVAGYCTVFKKVLNKFKEYGKLENINHDFKSQLFESFLKESISKKNWGQFFTPLKVIRGIEKMAMSEIKEGSVICDPACGVGKFLLEPIKSKLSDFYEVTDTKVIPKITIKGFDKGFDKDEQKTIILAKANMLIYFSDLIKENSHLTKEFSKVFNDTFNLKTNSILGTLSEPTKNEYDLILTNPPYVTSGSSNLKEEISKVRILQNYYKVNGMGVEGLFMEWIIRALKPNGKAFIVVPDGLFNRKNDEKLRKFIKDECFIDAIISLPDKTFFSTPKKTYILAITKKQSNEIQTEPVFTYLVSEIGESRDSYRFDIEQDDLSEAVNKFNQFKGAKQHYKTDDTRCKVLNIDWFDDFNSWVIENRWESEEKAMLGITESNLFISVDDFSFLTNDVSDTLLGFKDEIQTVNTQDESVEYKFISILDDIYFKVIRGKRITKSTINANKGDVPVYSSSKSKDKVMGYISKDFLIKEELIYCTKKSILFNLDGSVGYCFIRDDKEFSFIDVVASVTPQISCIDLDYLKIQLEREILKTGANYQTKLYFNKIESYNIQIKIPINSDGSFDMKKQKEIAKKYQKIQNIKESISNELLKIQNTMVEL